MYDLQTIRDRCNSLLAAAVISGDKKRIDELFEAKKFLEKDDCFVDADELKSMLILCDLGYSLSQTDEIYENFNKVEILLGFLEYIDKDGELIQVEAMLSPSIEDYYKFTDNLIFKFNKKNKKFYSLIDGEWVYDGDLERKFYDAEYDYTSIGYKIVMKDSPRR